MKGTAKVFRFNPMMDKSPYYQEYEYDYRKGMTILDVLNMIRETADPTLSYSYCCRNGHCGLCGLMANGKEVLSCKQAAQPGVRIEPLRNIRVLKDLTIDRDEYERKRPQLRLFLQRQCEQFSEPEVINMEEFEDFKTASRCVECFLCVSVCPIYKKSPHLFAGPAAFVLEARHFFDPRDDLNRKIMVKSEGIDLCNDCGLCSKVCNHGTDPASLIKKMKGA